MAGACPDAEALTLFVDGVAEPQLRRSIEAHVDGCSACLSLLAALGREDDGERSQSHGLGEPESPDLAAFEVGRRLARFVLLEVLGRGASGVVFAAYDDQLDRKVAIKLLHTGSATSPRAREAMLREARTLGRISHPNVVPVHEVGELDRRIYVVMEHVQGRTLRAWLSERERPWTEVVEAFVQAGRGLAAAHAAGVIHRDFKPDNVLVGDDGRVRVVDFGLARASSQLETNEGATDETGPRPEGQQHDRTRTGTLLGTPAYMAPEQWRGEALDGRCDQFAWCVALFEALHGERPFGGTTIAQLTERVLAGELREPPAGSGVPSRVARVLRRGLAVSPAERWPDMDALLAALAPGPRRLRLGLVSLGVALATAGVTYAAMQPSATSACDDARAEVEQAWGPGPRATVESALLGIDAPWANTTWLSTRERLDAYATSLGDAYEDACQAHARGLRSDEGLDAHGLCLDTRRRALEELVGVLMDATPGVAQHAVRAAESLPAIATCEQVVAPDRGPAAPEPAIAAQVHEIRSALSRVSVLQAAGEHTQAEAELEPLVAQTKALPHRPLQAEVELRRGAVLGALGRNDEADAALAEAQRLAQAARHDEVVVEATLERMFLQVDAQSQPAAVLAGRSSLEGILSRLGLDEREPAGTLRMYAGLARRDLGDFPGAEDDHLEALRIFEQDPGRGHRRHVNALANLGSVFLARGANEEALARFESALTAAEEVLGPSHPDVAILLNNIGIAANELGRTDEAVAAHARALEIREATFGADSVVGAQSLANYAAALVAADRKDEAVPSFQRAHAVLREALGEDHIVTAQIAYNLADLARQMGRLDDARAQLHEALGAFTRAVGDDHVFLAFPLTSLGECELAAGRPAAAVEFLERALVLRLTHEASPDNLAYTRWILAQALDAGGREPRRVEQLVELARVTFAASNSSDELSRLDAWRAARRGEDATSRPEAGPHEGEQPAGAP